ncbi:MAG TPA: aldo/keto reductase [Steroidobacteraceae bacterium]|jgi:diketogulonate reductase-like aldo/keto reductase|nr:aldo/keto reductase [Steroidobacteraceae bacterium]
MSRPQSPDVGRRSFVAGAVTAGIGALLARRLTATEPSSTAALPLITKAIPSSGERLAAIGIGTDSFREPAREEIRAELARMSELGGTVIDTAAAYGDSEALIGDALTSLGTRERMFVATKLVGSGFGVTGAESLTRSLEGLKTTHVDLLQVHNLNGVATLLPTLQRWKKEKKIRYIGVTTSRVSQHADMIATMRAYALDFIQVDYSIANRDAAQTILPLALERKTAVLVNLPFGRSSLFREAAGRALPPWAADIDVASWAQYFLKYIISHPAVTCAIPGSTQLSHLIDNQAAGRGRLADESMRRRMEAYWDNKFT